MPKTQILFVNEACGPLASALRLQGLGSENEAAQRVHVVDEESDAGTISQLAGLLKGIDKNTQNPPSVLVHIRNTLLQNALETRLEMDNIHPRPCIVSVDDLIASNFIAANPLFKVALWRDQPQVHVIIVGFGSLGKAFLDEILLDSIAAGLGKPMIDILTTDAQNTQEALFYQMPEIGASATVKVSALTLNDAGHSLTAMLAQAETIAPLTAIFVLLEDPSQTLIASATIGEYQDRSGLALANLFIGGPDAFEAVALVTPGRPARNMARQIKAICEFYTIPDLLTQIFIDRDIVARRMHSAYQAAYGQQNMSAVPWDILGETFRRANRRAARNLAQKLWAVGVFVSDDASDVHAVSQLTFENVITPLVRSPGENSVIRSLARLEHDRWCMDRRLDGWKYGETRDDLRRLHPSLIPFDDPRLSAGEIEKDIAQLRFILGSVVAPRMDGAAIRFTIGVIENTALAQPGIDMTTLVDRVETEADREIIVISPILNLPELAAVKTLTTILTAKNRDFHLIVPEWGTRDQTLRHADVIAHPDFCELLALKQTFVVPISSAISSTDDEWEDLSAGHEKREALQTYVMHRADALTSLGPDRI